MSLPTLEYIEKQKGREIPITFHKICPDSSNTIKSQACKQKKSLSIVTFFEKDDNFNKLIKNDIKKQLEDLNFNFIQTERLHCTFLGLYPSKQTFTESSNEHFDYLITEKVKEFFIDKKNNRYHTTFNLKYDEIRPGTWHGLHNNQIPNASDGTLVAIGNQDSDDNKKFVTLADELVCYLKTNLSQIFSNKFERKFSTIWSTVGFFYFQDFIFNQRFVDVFNQFKQSSNFKIKIKKLELVQYTYRDLRDANIIGEPFEF